MFEYTYTIVFLHDSFLSVKLRHQRILNIYTFQTFKLLSTNALRTVTSLRFYPTNRSARHSFTDAGRRYEAPGSETKDFAVPITKATHFVFILIPLVPPRQWDRVAQVNSTHTMEPLSLGPQPTYSTFEPEGDIIFIILESKQFHSVLQGKTLHLPQQFALQTSWKKLSETEPIRASVHKSYRNPRGPWRTVSSNLQQNPIWK